MRHAIRNLVTPDAFRGRIAAAHSTFALGGPQLGEFRAGAMAAAFGAAPAVALGGVLTIASCAVAMRLVPSLTRYDSATWHQEDVAPTRRPTTRPAGS
jgi:hypothetical protein